MNVPWVLHNVLVSYLDFCTDRVPEEWQALLVQNTRFEEGTVEEIGCKFHLIKVNGKTHCLDGPAVQAEFGNGWFQNGQLHRIDGPAIESRLAEMMSQSRWYKKGRLHRLDGPAMISSTGTKEWYQDGQLHRLDGPAKEYANGKVEWYRFGQRCPPEINKRNKKRKEKKMRMANSDLLETH